MSHHLVESLVLSEPCTLIITCLSYKGVKKETFLEFLDHKNFVILSLNIHPVRGVVTPHHTPPPWPLFLTVRLPVSRQCSPFFSTAVTESPALFPVLKACCLVTCEGGVFRAEGAFAAEGREVRSPSLSL